MNKASCGTAPAAHRVSTAGGLLPVIYKGGDSRTGVLHSVPQLPRYKSYDGREDSAHNQCWAEVDFCHGYSCCYCFYYLLSTCDLTFSLRSHIINPTLRMGRNQVEIQIQVEINLVSTLCCVCATPADLGCV